jgi:hypothetical protein
MLFSLATRKYRYPTLNADSNKIWSVIFVVYLQNSVSIARACAWTPAHWVALLEVARLCASVGFMGSLSMNLEAFASWTDRASKSIWHLYPSKSISQHCFYFCRWTISQCAGHQSILVRSNYRLYSSSRRSLLARIVVWHLHRLAVAGMKK